MLDADIKLNLPDRLLVKVDRASMANSLEVRSPFLDHKFVEFSARIPASYKIQNGEGKWLLKRAFRNDLPNKILNRSKEGFGSPVDEWIRGELRDLAVNSLDSLGDRPQFVPDSLSKLLRDHLDRRRNNGNKIWNLIILERWYQRYID
jgi:asparagine synthase (glutamine-hydrolysing)